MKQTILMTALLLLCSSAVLSQVQRAPRSQEQLNLCGQWLDNGRKVQITHSGSSVEARFLEPPVCDFQNEAGTKRPREVDFTGGLSGNELVGSASVCNFGERWGAQIGIQMAEMKLKVSDDGNTLNGTFKGWKGPVEMTLTRDCSGIDELREQIRILQEKMATLEQRLAEVGEASS
ncbi:MAG: hypothetical protein M3447_09615, partial [Acidobacteriota bacterium]|nr:hypothetical protein [Acidobacteriota bacterium]